jgi:hypothetical protein
VTPRGNLYTDEFWPIERRTVKRAFVRIRTEHFLQWLSPGDTLCRQGVESGGVDDEEAGSRGRYRVASLSKAARGCWGRRTVMTAASEYRGIAYSVANNDDGVWRWIVYPNKSRRIDVKTVAPRPTYETREAAVLAAKTAIDALLDGKSAKKVASDTAVKRKGDAGTQ